MAVAEFTPTERRILSMLADGKPHSSKEVLTCLNDDLSTLGTLRCHITNVRKKLRAKGEDIGWLVCNSRAYYLHVKQGCELNAVLES